MTTSHLTAAHRSINWLAYETLMQAMNIKGLLRGYAGVRVECDGAYFSAADTNIKGEGFLTVEIDKCAFLRTSTVDEIADIVRSALRKIAVSRMDFDGMSPMVGAE